MSSASSSPRFAAIVLAAGGGTRMGGGRPKQYRDLAGKPVLRHSLDVFARHENCERIVVVAAPEKVEIAAEIAGGIGNCVVVAGGSRRQESVANALVNLAGPTSPPAHVLIHDAARPGVDTVIIDRLLDALSAADGAVPVLAVPDSVARVAEGRLGESVDRAGLARMQTPQAFRFEAIRRAHAEWPADREATDDARMVMAAGGAVAAVAGSEALMKLTHPQDFETYASLHAHRKESNMRIGKGYDVHRLVEGRPLWLGGVRIEHDRGLAGHSDADVVIHALCDAIFGALGDGDIGSHFPPSDDKWKDAASEHFLAHAMERARAAGYELANCDLTIICEAPKIGPHREAMRARLARIMQVDEARVGVKATTTEGLGPMGRGEGVAAEAVALLVPC
jgi:2-C-methyl-D-erythritol 4-phosphate cytidylyltransferase/2-C-methyl-D-erythritol 2,4-cyclodiphosphate synthase